MNPEITREEFDEILTDLVNEDNASALLSIPGVSELVTAAFNEAVRDEWAMLQEIQP